jgi:hypothetical protein
MRKLTMTWGKTLIITREGRRKRGIAIECGVRTL